MPATQTPAGLLADLAQRGFTLRTTAGKIVVTPASRLTPQDRQALMACRADLLTILSPCEPWNPVTAHRLMSEADTLVVSLGVDGRHPAISEAAAMVVSAYATQDLETVRFAAAEFTALVRKLAAELSCSGLHSVPGGG